MKKASNRHAKHRPRVVLQSWRALIEHISKMNEKELEAALRVETEKPRKERREDVILRIHRRFSKLRQERELSEYLT